jgi:GTPase SAR1 family protein
MVHVNDVNLEHIIWDTAGQERFSSLVPMYGKDSNAYIIVASLESKILLQNIYA